MGYVTTGGISYMRGFGFGKCWVNLPKVKEVQKLIYDNKKKL
jgi:hypothetical protein